MKDRRIQTAIRLPQSLLDRADRIAERMSQPGLPVTRTEILRLATTQGMDQLERKKKK